MDVDKPNLGRDMSQSSGGYELVLSGVLFSLLGLWIDRRIGTVPLFTIVLAVVGFGGSVANIYYRYQRQISQLQAETAEIREGGS